MTKREANLNLLAHWTQAWTTLGRWQALNARLSRETSPQHPGWALRRATGQWRAPVGGDPAGRASAR